MNGINNLKNPLDVKSKLKAYTIFDNKKLRNYYVGSFINLQNIHKYIFDGLYDFAGQIRTRTISKGGFIFANGDYLPEILKSIDNMKDNTLEEIISKYIEMNIAHPFMEGNGRATRIWLDLLLIDRLKVCIDWSKIDKKEYLDAMKVSPNNDKKIKDLIKNSLTKDINNRELFMKGIDTSYYYEEVDD